MLTIDDIDDLVSTFHIEDIDDFMKLFFNWVKSMGHQEIVKFCQCYKEDELLDEEKNDLEDILFSKFAKLYYDRVRVPVVMVLSAIEYMSDNAYCKLSTNKEQNSILIIIAILNKMFEYGFCEKESNIIDNFRAKLHKRCDDIYLQR